MYIRIQICDFSSLILDCSKFSSQVWGGDQIECGGCVTGYCTERSTTVSVVEQEVVINGK